ncbi:MAG: sugar ABC transporter ATP-binding protein, partial [Actinomycetota bacterium]
VTIARWLAKGLKAMLLFDPTRGIDVGTKHQVYDLIRALADEGTAILMFTSELREIALVCDRAVVLHNGAIVAEMPPTASENDLLTAAHGLEVTAV